MCSFLLDELNETFDRTVTRIFDWGSLLASRIHFDGGESANIIWNIVRCSIAFSDNNFIRVSRVRCCELFIFRCKSLAMAALNVSYNTTRLYPRSVEFNENILLIIEDNVVVIMG